MRIEGASRAEPARPGLWRHGDYLKLWGAQGISAFGSQITLVALPLVAILTLEASAFQVAALTAAELVPFALLGIPAGVWVDRLTRRPILVLADVGRAALLLSIPLAYWLDALTLIQLYVIALAVGVLTVFFTLAYQAYVPAIVAREDLIAANARFEATETLARFGGPAAGGGLVAALSAPVAILADALSFVASGALIFSIEHREPRRTRPSRPAFWSELREGARLALSDPYIVSVLVTTAIINVGFNAAWAVLLVFAVRELELGAGLVGLVLAAGEVGGLAGALVTTWLARLAGTGRVIIGSAALFGPAVLVVAAAPESSPLPFLVVGLAVASFAGVVYNASTVGLRQARVPLELQGRVVGFNRTIVWGVSPLGALLGGVLAAGAGVRVAMLAGGAIACLAVLPALASPLRGLRGLPEGLAP